MPHPACVIAGVITLAYVGWLARVWYHAHQKARQRDAVIARQQEALIRAQRQLQTVLEEDDRTPVPAPIRSTAKIYAFRAKN